MKKIISTLLLTIAILTMQGCEEKKEIDRSYIEGSYIVIENDKPYKQGSRYLTATLGKKIFASNFGGGTYEIVNNKVIVQGELSHVFLIQGDDLISDTLHLRKSTDSEIRALQIKAKKEVESNAPNFNNDRHIGY